MKHLKLYEQFDFDENDPFGEEIPNNINIKYSRNSNGERFYSDDFDIIKIFKKLELISLELTYELTDPDNNINLNKIDVIWDLNSNSMSFHLQFKNITNRNLFIDEFSTENPLNDYNIIDENHDESYNLFRFNLYLYPVDIPTPYNGLWQFF